MKCGHLDTVKFVETQSPNQSSCFKGIRWLMLCIVYTPGEMDKVLQIMLADHDFLLLYDKDTSYFWNYRSQLIGSCQEIGEKDCSMSWPFGNNYEKYLQMKSSSEEMMSPSSPHEDPDNGFFD